MRVGWHFSAAVGLSLAVAGTPLTAQSVLVAARMEATLPMPGEAVPVRLTYTLRPGPGVGDIPLSLLTPEPVRLRSFRSLLGGEERTRPGEGGLESLLEEIRVGFWEGAMQLPRQPTGAEDSLSLTLTYLVEGAWEGDGKVSLPLVSPHWVPDPPTPRSFMARVAIPQGYTVAETFPTSLLSRPEPGKGGILEIGLQSVPSLVVVRLASGDGGFLTLERGLDALVVTLLLVMGGLGLRYLRSKAR